MFPENIRRKDAEEVSLSLHEQLYNQKGYSGAEVEILLKLERLETEVKNFRESAAKYVRIEEFLPIQRLVYGMVGLILTGFLVAIIALVVK